MPGELIDREALERIIQRAAELQAGAQDIGDGLTQNQVLALGKDVGIPSRYLQQAMLEERTRAMVETPRGWWAWLTGPRSLSADRVVRGDPAAVERALAHWMEEEESLQVKRRYADRTTWEPKAGAFATIQRAIGSKGRRFALADAAEVAGQATPLEPGFCHVGLVADVRPTRARRVRISAILFAFALLCVALTLPFGLIALLPAAVIIPTAAGLARHHRVENERVHTAMEQVLDRIERGEIRPDPDAPSQGVTAFIRIADEIRKTLRP